MSKMLWLRLCVMSILGTCIMFPYCNQKDLKVADTRKTEATKKEVTVKIDQKLFLKVPLNSNEPNPCSPPDPGPNWRGIVIQAPDRVSFKRGEKIDEYGAFAIIPICGYRLLDVPIVPWRKPMRLVAVDKRTGVVYSGDVIKLDPSPEVPPPLPEKPLTPEQVKGLAAGGYFNPNLADFMSLPEAPAVYDVYVEFRGFKSNIVTIEIVEEDK